MPDVFVLLLKWQLCTAVDILAEDCFDLISLLHTLSLLLSHFSYSLNFLPSLLLFLGGKHSLDCTLILTEGDSAKSLAVSGLAVIGRDRYGVFPLRGKILNVREASHKQVRKSLVRSWSTYSFCIILNCCFCFWFLYRLWKMQKLTT